jgi:predicted CoA-substrate-specific enzyme activase
MITAGIDVGIQSIKAVVLSNNHIEASETDHDCNGGTQRVPGSATSNIHIVAAKTLITEEEGAIGSRIVLEDILTQTGLSLSDINYIVATGAGRSTVSFAHKTRTEQLCHARGAFYSFPTARTVLDIGAEGTRAMKLDQKGGVKNFACNSKCAAGTGAFIEIMATLLEVSLDEVGESACRAPGIERVSSYRTVFAESEVISHIHKGKSKETILAGIVESVAERSFELLQKIGIERDVVLSGGTAKNIGIRKALERMGGEEFLCPPDPQIAGALGAALIAQDYLTV